MERLEGFTGIGGDTAFDFIPSVGGPVRFSLRRRDRDLEADLHGQGIDLGFGELGELGCGSFAFGGQGGGSVLVGGRGLDDRRTQFFEDFVAIFYLGEFVSNLFSKDEDIGDGLPILALQAIEQSEAVFDFGQTLGTGIDSLGIVAQGCAGIAQRGARGGQLLGDLNETPVVTRQFFNAAQCGAKRAFSRGAAFVELVVGVHGCGIELFRVGQHALLGLEGLVFPRLELSGINFFVLIAPEIDHAQAVLFAFEKIV